MRPCGSEFELKKFSPADATAMLDAYYRYVECTTPPSRLLVINFWNRTYSTSERLWADLYEFLSRYELPRKMPPDGTRFPGCESGGSTLHKTHAKKLRLRRKAPSEVRLPLLALPTTGLSREATGRPVRLRPRGRPAMRVHH